MMYTGGVPSEMERVRCMTVEQKYEWLENVRAQQPKETKNKKR